MFAHLDEVLEKMGIETLSDIPILEPIPDEGKELSQDEILQYLKYHPDSGALNIEAMDELPVLYIKSRSVMSNIWSKFGAHKFHILWCPTLSGMFENDRGNRYVVVPAKNKILQHIFEYEEKLQELLVCKNCLAGLKNKWDINKTVNTFKLNDVVGQYKTQYEQLPVSEYLVPRKGGYPSNWNKISRRYRESKDWKCEDCFINCSNDTDLLDAHHVDGNGHNINNDNLKALCKLCHAQQYGHNHYKSKITANQRNRISKLRQHKY